MDRGLGLRGPEEPPCDSLAPPPCPWAGQSSEGPGTGCGGLGTVDVFDKAVSELAEYWSPLGLGDAGAALSCLAFLVDQAERHLWDVVADARDEGHSWQDIAGRLARPAPSVEGCYTYYASWRRATRGG